MAIERSLFTPPEGLDDVEVVEGVEIELETPEIALLDDGSAEITLVEEVTDLSTAPFDANLAEYMDDGQLTAMSTELVACVQTYINSRREWADTFVKGLEVLGFNYENRTEPWQDACGVYSTVLAEAAIRFQAEAMSETFPAAGPV